MKKIFSFFIVLGLLFILVPGVFAKKSRALPKTITVKSASFKGGAFMPVKYAMTPDVPGGQNISPQLSWKTKRTDIKSYALFMFDPHPVAQNWVHWCVVNIPPSVNALAEGASSRNMPEGVLELFNSYGELGYGGPAAPPGTGVHDYQFWIYGLKTSSLALTECTKGNFEKAIKGKVLAKGKLIGKFEQK